MSYSPNDTLLGVRTLYPRYQGIPITPLDIYSFSIQVKVDLQPVTIRTAILWFNEAGDNQDLVGKNDLPLSITDLLWHTFTVQGIAPAAAAYAVPGIHFKDRLAGSDPLVSPNIYFCAAQFMRVGTSATVAASSPDRYLTLTGPGEPPTQANAEEIGPPGEGFDGYLIGDPTP